MRRYLELVCAIFVTIVVLLTGCQANQPDLPEEVSFDQLFASPGQYDGKEIVLDGYYFAGFETIVIAEEMEYSGYAEGNLIPSGRLIWVDGGMPIEIYAQLYRQDMMGPEERYGKIRLTGRFEYGGKYGHLGSFDCQVVLEEAELLPWSPPAPTPTGEATIRSHSKNSWCYRKLCM
jgi:hypothetical protein